MNRSSTSRAPVTRASPPPRPDDGAINVFVARQPIFDKYRRVFAYELLFRHSFENACGDVDKTDAARHVLSNAILTFGLDAITAGKRAFINMTAETLTSGAATLVPPDRAVIEILEDVQPTPAVIAACRQLKKEGFVLALDDFAYYTEVEPLLELVDIVKVAFRVTPPAERKTLAQRLLPRGIQMLAEQVETREELDQAIEYGYSYFQGYFFCRPEVMSRRELGGSRGTYLKILTSIHQPSLDYLELEQIIKRDVAVSHKLLRYLNSAWFAFRVPITSIRHGLVLLGEDDVRRWASLMALGGLGRRKPQELLVTSAVRAHFCEALASRAGLAGREFDLFLLGAFSLMDALLDQPMTKAAEEIPLPSDVEAALLDRPSPLRPVLDFAIAYEQGHWARVDELMAALGLDSSVTPGLFLDALRWSRDTFGT